MALTTTTEQKSTPTAGAERAVTATGTRMAAMAILGAALSSLLMTAWMHDGGTRSALSKTERAAHLLAHGL